MTTSLTKDVLRDIVWMCLGDIRHSNGSSLSVQRGGCQFLAWEVIASAVTQIAIWKVVAGAGEVVSWGAEVLTGTRWAAPCLSTASWSLPTF